MLNEVHIVPIFSNKRLSKTIFLHLSWDKTLEVLSIFGRIYKSIINFDCISKYQGTLEKYYCFQIFCMLHLEDFWKCYCAKEKAILRAGFEPAT